MTSLSRQPRRQRKAGYTAHSFERRRRMTVPLSRELRRRFGRRAVPVRKGDTVRILAGSYVGREERVAKVHRRAYSVTLDNVTGKTGDQKLKPLPIRTSQLVITRLNLSDVWRRRALRVATGGDVEEAPPDETLVGEGESGDAESPAREERSAASKPSDEEAETEPAEPAARST